MLSVQKQCLPVTACNKIHLHSPLLLRLIALSINAMPLITILTTVGLFMCLLSTRNSKKLKKFVRRPKDTALPTGAQQRRIPWNHNAAGGPFLL
jgi:hypothetical protein